MCQCLLDLYKYDICCIKYYELTKTNQSIEINYALGDSTPN